MIPRQIPLTDDQREALHSHAASERNWQQPYFGDLEMPSELRVPEMQRRFQALREDKLQIILRRSDAAEDMREHLRKERWIKGVFWTCVITALGSLAILKILGLL